MSVYNATSVQKTENMSDALNFMVRPGDVWILGDHRLLCGDSTKNEDIEKLMNGEKADIVFTDPPYGMKKEKDGILNDNLNLDNLLEFNKRWIPLSFVHTKENGSWYCWGKDEPLMDIYSKILKPMIEEHRIVFRNLITWDKGSGQGQLSKEFRMYPVADEKCLFVMTGICGFNVNLEHYYEGWEPIRAYLLQSRLDMGWDVPAMKRIVGHSDTSGDHWTSKSQFCFLTEKNYNKLKEAAERERMERGIDNKAFKKEYSELKSEYEDIKQAFLGVRAYFDNTHGNMNSVWHFGRSSREERMEACGHATVKPVALCSRAIKSSTRENESVLDLFGGSGSTLIACEQLKRKCYMMELSPKWCGVIIRRWQRHTGKIATLESNKKEY